METDLIASKSIDYMRLASTGSDDVTSSPDVTTLSNYTRLTSIEGESMMTLTRSNSMKSEVDYSYRASPLWVEETMPIELPDHTPLPAITLQDIGIIPSKQLDENAFGKVRFNCTFLFTDKITDSLQK